MSCFLSCDWGTTSFRLHLADAETGSTLFTIDDSDGVRQLYNIWSAKKHPPDRDVYFLSLLREKIAILEKKTSRVLDNCPLVISGMASANIGWKELPYASLPLSLDQPALKLDVRKIDEVFPHEIILVSGIQSTNDVIRGEETQLLGISKEYNLKNGICIIPGTHSKHLYVKNGALAHFRTYLSGELFELLIRHSILRSSVSSSDSAGTGISEYFKKGIQRSADENLLHSLFTIRANHLLHDTNTAANHDFLSGLLIGTELRDLPRSGPGDTDTIIVAGGNHLQPSYSAGLDFLGISHMNADVSVDLTAKGHSAILKNLRATF